MNTSLEKTISAVIFDLDGTLLNTLEDLTSATNFVQKKHGIPASSTDEVRRFVGNGLSNLMVRAMPETKENDNISAIQNDEQKLELHKKMLAEFTAYYNDHCEEKTKPYDGVPELLQQLKSAGIKTAVVSNKADFAVKKLCKNFFGDLLETAIGEAEQSGIRKKPAPDMVKKAMDVLGCNPDETVYVGDSEVDLKTAENSHLPCISVTWGFRSKEHLIDRGATVIADDIEQLTSLLVGKNGGEK
jgi:phosphoglycolate phosphatase